MQAYLHIFLRAGKQRVASRPKTRVRGAWCAHARRGVAGWCDCVVGSASWVAGGSFGRGFVGHNVWATFNIPSPKSEMLLRRACVLGFMYK